MIFAVNGVLPLEVNSRAEQLAGRMHHPLFAAVFVTTTIALATTECGAGPLTVVADFEGASVEVLDIDEESRTISFMPGGDPARGWPCWWYFRIDGIEPGETITLRLRGSTAALENQRPLSSVWALPKQATYSIDRRTWQHTDEGQFEGEWITYTIAPEAESMFVAWGPPFTPTMATEFVQQMSELSSSATAAELCESREGRSVPMLSVSEGDRPTDERFGIWVQARQHAWESGSSWVARGFVEWLLSDDADAAWLRQQAEIYIVPIVDVDNTATGNGGKNELPHDHNRDWSESPHFNETLAAQRIVGELIDAGRMDVFLDLHNPAPGDPTFFYILPSDLLEEPMISLRNRFIELAYERISRAEPRIPMSSQPKETGPSYHPLWERISATWVSLHGNPHTMSICLETGWNHSNSTTSGYRAVGASLAQTVQAYLVEASSHESCRDPSP